MGVVSGCILTGSLLDIDVKNITVGIVGCCFAGLVRIQKTTLISVMRISPYKNSFPKC